MASLAERFFLNVAGRFYIDSSCIDCDQCRALAPDFFARDTDNHTFYLRRQPSTREEIDLVQRAFASCAAGSIGDDGPG